MSGDVYVFNILGVVADTCRQIDEIWSLDNYISKTVSGIY